MATYFCSDQHLTLRYPERGERFARFLGILEPVRDQLVIAGDLCDFWFVARESHNADIMAEPGMAALARFIGDGGQVKILAGNHDQHLEWFYRQHLGLSFLPETWDVKLEGRKLHLAHGHLLGGRSRWKGCMEGKAFLAGFQRVPSVVADNLAARLKKYNSRNRKVDNLRHYMVFERYVKGLNQNSAELVILGHVHQTIFQEIPIQESGHAQSPSSRQLAVLGHWFHQASWLKMESGQAEFYIWQDGSSEPEQVRDARVQRPVE